MIAMDNLWRLMTAIFIILIGAAALLTAYILFVNSALAGICVWTACVCILLAIAKGLFAIIDHHRGTKE